MHARVLLIDGTNTFTTYWIRHTGKDVYHGWHPNQKGSYHASGQSHNKTRSGEVSDIEKHTPLAELKGVHILASLGWLNHPNSFEGQMSTDLQYRPQLKKSRSDAILMIDSRAIPLEANIQLTIGLLEPGNLTALDRVVYRYSDANAIFFHTKQLLLDTSVKPWVWAKVDMATQEQSTERIAKFFASDRNSGQHAEMSDFGSDRI